jgi:hypothetical protein
MKLLTTIAAVLISISAFSQDLIEYENGTFTQNGEELSMEQIDDLTLLHKAGRDNVRRGNRFDLKYNDIDLRIDDNALNALGGVASGAAGGFLGMTAAAAFSFVEISAMHFIVTAAAGGLCVVSYKAFSRIASSPEECLRKRDKQFNKVADKLNQKVADKLNRGIKAANQ